MNLYIVYFATIHKKSTFSSSKSTVKVVVEKQVRLDENAHYYRARRRASKLTFRQVVNAIFVVRYAKPNLSPY